MDAFFLPQTDELLSDLGECPLGRRVEPEWPAGMSSSATRRFWVTENARELGDEYGCPPCFMETDSS
jgi:hypothetical protein